MFPAMKDLKSKAVDMNDEDHGQRLLNRIDVEELEI